MKNPIKIYERGDEQMSHRKAAVLAVVLAFAAVVTMSMCGGSSDKVDDTVPVTLG